MKYEIRSTIFAGLLRKVEDWGGRAYQPRQGDGFHCDRCERHVTLCDSKASNNQIQSDQAKNKDKDRECLSRTSFFGAKV